MRLTFYGATSTVTGSKTLVEIDGKNVLVDCGLFQGIKSLRLRNRALPPFDAKSIDSVVLTHAHIDHSGYLPALVNAGFRGPVYCTEATQALLEILLPDSGYLQEEEARVANRRGFSRHKPALPLYTQADAERALGQLRGVAFSAPYKLGERVTMELRRAGHILGAASVKLGDGRRSVTFSGDVGRLHDALMRAPEPLSATDALVVESTYGDRRHPSVDEAAVLETVIRDTVERGGVVVVPSFAVGRAQALLHQLARLRAADRIPDVPIYLDSPMAIDATRIFLEHPEDHRLGEQDCAAMGRVARYVNRAQQSKALDEDGSPKIIVSASGMATGGRVLHHLKRYLPEPENAIVLVGFQAAGTRGRALADGVDEIKIHGEYVPVRAAIHRIEGLSAHADYAELLQWLSAMPGTPRQVFVNHGEPAAADAFRRRLEERFGWNVILPEYGETFTVD